MTARYALRTLAVITMAMFAIAAPAGIACAHEGEEHEEKSNEQRGGGSTKMDMDEEDEEGMHEDDEGTARGSDRMKGDVRIIEIVVSEEGFNGEAGPFALRLNQGEPTELKFVYGDGTHGHENRHVIEIQGLGIKTRPLDAGHPEQVVRFTPDKSGDYQFRCTYLCHGHANLQGGLLRVGPAAAMATRVDLAVRPSGGARLVLIATVKDERGRPVVGASLHFFVFTELFDSLVDIGEGTTNKEGDAILAFTPTIAGGAMFEARFEGQDVFEPSEGSTRYLVQTAIPGLLAEKDSFRVPFLRPWLILVLVAGVFFVYGAALFQLRGLRNS